MTTVNDKDRVSTDIKILECDIKRKKYLQCKMKFKAFARVNPSQGIKRYI